MRYECTRWGILIDEKYLSAREAVDLFHWLADQHEGLLFICQQEPIVPQEAPVTSEQRQGEWSEEEEQEIRSEDEQITYL